MLNRSASLAMSTSVFKALPGKLDIKRHSPSIFYVQGCGCLYRVLEGVALCLARASRLVASVTKTIVDSTGLLFVDKRSYYSRLLMLMWTAAIWTYP